MDLIHHEGDRYDRRELPLNQPIAIEFTPAKTRNIEFACGMNMLHGTVVVN